jgi:nuclear migration protein JNM1
LPAGVDASEVDFSDRVDGKRKSYKASTRRQRILEDGTEELGDLSDDEDLEILERKVARLRRELEEVKEEYGKRKVTGNDSSAGVQDYESQISSLSRVLDEVSKSADVVQKNGRLVPHKPSRSAQLPSTDNVLRTAEAERPGATYTVTYAPTYEQSHALVKTADFDRRLLLLEKAIGITSTAVPGVDATGLPRAIMPTLETLQRQISTLSQATTSNLDTASRRIRTLIQEAEKLVKARADAKAAQEALGPNAPAAIGGDDVDQAAKINALYGTLPTIENLNPLLPSLLDRLRSLRAIHADASTASETLDRIEKQQADMAAELKQWRDGLDKIEGAMKEGDEAWVKNQKVMEAWVKGLEERIIKLA